MKKVIYFTTKSYFEGMPYYLGWAFAVAALIVIPVQWYLAPIFGLLSFLILTGNYKIAIDREHQVIEDFLSLLGTKSQVEKFRYSAIECIYITQSKYAQKLNMDYLSSTVSGKMYNAYLRTDSDNIFLGESKNLNKLKAKLKPLAKELEIGINEYLG